MQFEAFRAKYGDAILKIAGEYHIENVRVFGSVATGLSSDESDIDFVVSLGKQADLFDLGGFQYRVSRLLKGKKVDIIPENSIHWYIKDQILQEARSL